MFTVVDETLLRRAPFAFADRLVDVEMWMGDTRVSRQLYTPLTGRPRQDAYRGFTVTMRSVQIQATAAAVKTRIWRVDPNLPIDSPTIIQLPDDPIISNYPILRPVTFRTPAGGA